MTALLLALTLAAAGPKGASSEAAGMLEELRRMIPAGTFEGAVGDYTVYKVGSLTPRYWRLAVVGREPAPLSGVWLETSFGSQPGGTGMIALKTLCRGDPRLPRSIAKAYFRFGAGKTVELDAAELQEAAPEAAEVPQEEGALPESMKTVDVKMTPAGSFRAVRAETDMGYTVWLSPQVPIFHVVAMNLPTGAQLELVAVGHDAKDTLGEPQAKTSPKAIQKLIDSPPDGGAP